MANSASSSVTQYTGNSSTEALNKGKKIKNAQLAEFPCELESLNKWSILKISNRDIYKIEFWDYKSLIAIKTLERTVTIDDTEQTIKLLSAKDIEPYMNSHKYIHIGLIQVAFKPLTLRDGRCLNWRQSLTGIMETSLCNGPVYFNVYPNLSLSLTDPNILESVKLNIKTHGYDFLPESETIAIIYRIHYKALATLASKAKNHTKPGKTVLIETNLLSSNIATNMQIKWDEVNFPDSWILPQAVQPRPIINKDIDQIIETNDGEVEVIFNPVRSIKVASESSSSRRSFYHNNSVRYSDPKGIEITNTIPHPIYKEEETSSLKSKISFRV